MDATPLACPNCGTPMARRSDPDVAVEECPKCGGLFIEAGALNRLATGLSGDIELITIDPGKDFQDRYPPRPCPRCRTAMKKEDLLMFTPVILDHCVQCGGWFLDRTELPEMNRLLSRRRETHGGTADVRAERRGHWITIDRTKDVYTYTGGGFAPAAVPVAWTRIAVYFRRPLGAGLHIAPETWTRKLAKLFGARDVRVGDAEFDRAFLVTAEDPAAGASALAPAGRTALLAFAASPLAGLGYKRAWEVFSDRIVFSFTDWGREGHRPSLVDEQRLQDALIDVAEALEGSR